MRGLGFLTNATLPGVKVGSNNGSGSSSSNSGQQGNTQNSPCDCTNCKEDIVVEARYLRKTQARADDIRVEVVRRKYICPDAQPPVVECEEKLAQIKQRNGLQGLYGLSGCSSCQQYSNRM